VRLVSPRLALLHGGFVLVLAEVHELADRRLRQRGDLDEIEIGLDGQSECVLDSDDPDLLAVRADEANLGDPDPVIDAWLDADGASLLVRMGDPPPRSRRPLTRRAQGSRQGRRHGPPVR
jgi:hypothetical protein